MKKIFGISTAALALMPMLALAQQQRPVPGTTLFNDATGFVGLILNFINGALVPLLFGLIFFYFAWGVYNTLVKGAESADLKEAGKKQILNSIIGAVLILTFWALVNFVASGLNLGSGQITVPQVPTIRTQQGSGTNVPLTPGTLAP